MIIIDYSYLLCYTNKNLYGEKIVVKFIVVRHGFSTSNLDKTLTGHLDAPLVDIGHKQGEAVSDYIFNNYKIDAIYSSDLIRAVQTIEKLAFLTKLPIIKNKGLREICCGVWEGLKISQIMQENFEEYDRWRNFDSSIAPKGGETFEDVKLRALNTLKNIAEQNDGKTIVIATHGGLIKVVQGYCLGLEGTRLNEIPYLSNGALLELEYTAEKFKISHDVIDSYLENIKTEMPKEI